MKRHIVEIVFAERCPSVRHALERVREALAPVRDTVDLELRVTRVEWVERGVPAVLIDGALVTGGGVGPIRAALERARTVTERSPARSGTFVASSPNVCGLHACEDSSVQSPSFS